MERRRLDSWLNRGCLGSAICLALWVATCVSGKGPLMAFLEGPYSPAARRQAALVLFGTETLPQHPSQWRAYHRADYDFQGDFDRWTRLDEVTETELALVQETLTWRPRLELDDCDEPNYFAEHRGPPRWWPQSREGLRLAQSDGGPAMGYCLWVDEGHRRVFLYDFKF